MTEKRRIRGRELGETHENNMCLAEDELGAKPSCGSHLREVDQEGGVAAVQVAEAPWHCHHHEG